MLINGQNSYTNEWLSNPHSTGRLNLIAWFWDLEIKWRFVKQVKLVEWICRPSVSLFYLRHLQDKIFQFWNKTHPTASSLVISGRNSQYSVCLGQRSPNDPWVQNSKHKTVQPLWSPPYFCVCWLQLFTSNLIHFQNEKYYWGLNLGIFRIIK